MEKESLNLEKWAWIAYICLHSICIYFNVILMAGFLRKYQDILIYGVEGPLLIISIMILIGNVHINCKR